MGKHLFKSEEKRLKLINDIQERMPSLNLHPELLTNEQMIILLLNEDLKVKNLSILQIQIKYSVGESYARKIKYIVVNKISQKDIVHFK